MNSLMIILLTQYCWGDQIENDLGGDVARMGESRGVCRVLVGKPEGKRSLGRPRHRWEDNIKIDLQEMRCGGMDWIDLPQEWNAVMNLRVPYYLGSFLTT